jgi:protochlorophyllide reductase
VDEKRSNGKKSFSQRVGGMFINGIVYFAVITRLIIYFLMLECKEFDIGPQNGKIFIVTGANSGLGYATTVALVKAGGHVIMGCRDLLRGNEARDKILKHIPNGKISVSQLDLSSLSSVRNFVEDFKLRHAAFDVLINNAGIMAVPKRELSLDGIEMQIATNHFGHFLLTALLLPYISRNGRVINHSSGAYIAASPRLYFFNKFPFNDIQSHLWYNPWVAYGNSKAANLYFTYELNQRLQKSKRSDIKSIAVHPGYTATNLQTNAFPFGSWSNALFAMDANEGAQSQILAAVDSSIKASDNDFLGPRYLAFGPPAVTYTGMKNVEAQRVLWEESLRLTGITDNDMFSL